MKIRELIVEADPAELGPMNDKMKSVLGKVHADDEEQARTDAEAKAKAKEDQRAEAARLRKENPEMLEKYIDMLKKHDWTYEYSDGYSRAYVKGQEEHYDIMNMAKKIDPDFEIYNKYDPLKKEDMGESATAGATSAGNVASVANPQVAYSKPKRDSKGVPQAKQKKKKDGTAVNALDMGTSIFGGGAVKR